MSGLCGWIGFGTAAPENRQLIERMAAPLARFDGSKVEALAAGKSAVALAARNQSGDIYQNNGLLVAVAGQARFQDVRLTHKAHAEGFAKTLADEWRVKGAQVCASLLGAFSLAILDEDSGEALLAIDRTGTQPLSYQVSGDTLVFGSSADAIIQHPLAPPDLDPQAMYNYVYFHMVPSPGTIYKDQRRLLPGEYLSFKKGRVETGKYWTLQYQEDTKADFGDLKEEFLQVLRSSVGDAIDGLNVGAFLSGGTDSSTIAGILGQVSGKPARTYSIGFDAKGYDEMEYARIAVRHFWHPAS